jgi:hypothetical protein
MALRTWQINLTLLSERELNCIEQFFEAQLGEYTTFVFPDPFSGQAVPNCRFSGQSLTSQYEASDSGMASLWIVETNG